MWLIDLLLGRPKGLKSTAVVEKELTQLYQRAKKYLEVNGSQEVQDFLTLQKVVETVDFQQKKKLYTLTKYKDTKEYKQLHRLASLERKWNVWRYCRLLKKSKSPRIDKKIARLTTTPQVEEYLRLQQLIQEPDFKSRNTFWSNPNRWLTTPEGKQEQEYKSLCKHPNIRLYRSCQNDRFLEAGLTYKTAFSDDFTWKDFSWSAWQAGFVYPNEDCIKVHSYIDEQQGYSGGKNVTVDRGVLTIHTRKEKLNALAWDEKMGFRKKDFAYTSDVLTTANKVRLTCGSVVQIKALCKGHINHCIALETAQQLPIIVLAGQEKDKRYVGIRDTKGTRKKYLSGIRSGKPYIYTLVWERDSLTWYVNNLLMYRLIEHIPSEEMFIQMYSFNPIENKPAIGELSVEWVKCFQRK